jgi:membrane protein CcdC involved in cytochrome C biogenesis
MGNWALRIPVWFISLSAVIGNLFVVIVISTSHFRLTVSKFLMCNLAVADLCIGIHLLLIAVVDACSIRAYFNYAIDWQEGMNGKFYVRSDPINRLDFYKQIKICSMKKLTISANNNLLQ